MKIEVRPFVKCSKEEWQCYANTANYFVNKVNEIIAEVLVLNDDPIKAQKDAYDRLYEYREYGFTDSECSQVATDIINLYYKSNINRWDCLKYE